ncbi:transposable element Tcb1 transposase [Trichonephila clavipes]|nr:transposable element Tcb1 transposase [Trichonephila clavipes]
MKKTQRSVADAVESPEVLLQGCGIHSKKQEMLDVPESGTPFISTCASLKYCRILSSDITLITEGREKNNTSPANQTSSKIRGGAIRTTKKTSLREDGLLHRISLSNRKLNSSQILKQWTLISNVSVCPRTVRERLQENGLRGCKARPKPLLTKFQRKRRLTWARKHLLWTIKDWEKVIFSDESQFFISGNHSSVYVRGRTHEEFSPQCLKPTVKYPTKVMVWGCMSSHGVGRLYIASGKVKAMDYIEIPQNKLLPTARNQSWIFQDDNAPCHCAKVVPKWLNDHTGNRINWPGQSPDLNPIDSLWFKIGYETSKKKPSNKCELIEALIFSFNHIVTKDLLLKLVHSMPKRCRAVIKANGWPIKY